MSKQKALESSKSTNGNWIEEIQVIGGFSDGIHLKFKPGLNCIIGQKGAGKTTILELIRFAMDVLPDGEIASQETKRIESLINKNLAGGRVQLRVRTQDGLVYLVSRTADTGPIVKTESGAVTEMAVSALFRPHIYSQKEIELVADQADAQMALVDHADGERIGALTHTIRGLVRDLRQNAVSLSSENEKLNSLSEQLARLIPIEDRLAELKAVGKDSVQIEGAHKQKSLRDRELRSMESGLKTVAEVKAGFPELSQRLQRELEQLSAKELQSGRNAKRIMEARSRMERVVNKIVKSVDDFVQDLNQLEEEFGQDQLGLVQLHREQEVEYRALIESAGKTQSLTTERAKLEVQRNQLLELKRQKEELDAKIQKLSEIRQQLLARISEAGEERFRFREAVVKRINKALEPDVRVEIHDLGDDQDYRAVLEERLKGAKVSRASVAQKLAMLPPTELVEALRGHNAVPLIERAGLSKEQAEKVLEALSTPENIYELEAAPLHDRTHIQLADHGTFKDSRNLSTGQKCTAILPILLLHSETPLLVDQPEDNLDNRFISSAVVSRLSLVKQKRQLILVTHNPNVCVLPDAENILVLDSNGTASKLIKSGTVDECKQEILGLLEGGAEAFEQRRIKYGR